MPPRPKTPTVTPTADTQSQRFLRQIDQWLVPFPKERAKRMDAKGTERPELRPVECNGWDELISFWRIAMEWRRDMSQVLATMLAVAISTRRKGDQLFLMVLGQPGGGKTRLCDAMLVARDYTMSVENVTGLTSGWRAGMGQDNSLIVRGNNFCWITPEADVLIRSPQFASVMSQSRRVFDGKTTASYKTLSEDREYNDLRLTWIWAGTPAMLNDEQSGLGDRFLKIRLNPPPDSHVRKVTLRVATTSWNDVADESHGEKQMNQAMQDAYERTAGYLCKLINDSDAIANVRLQHADQFARLGELGAFVAYFRARPNKKDPDAEAVVEQPTRITGQLSRISRCLCVVMQKEELDEEVLRITEKIAIDSSQGPSWDIGTTLYERGDCTTRALEIYTNLTLEVLNRYLKFMKAIGVVDIASGKIGKKGILPTTGWKLTPLGRRLCETMLGVEESVESHENDDVPF